MKQSCISYFLKADTPGRAAGRGDTILLRGGSHSMNSVGQCTGRQIPELVWRGCETMCVEQECMAV